jgi:ribokinase
MRLTVLGNVCLDVVHRLDRLPGPGETVNARAVAEDLGGKGLNQAIAARRAGAAVRLVAPVGTDGTADLVRARLAAEDIADDGLVVLPGRSDRSTVMVDAAGENVIVTDAAKARGLTLAEAEPRLDLRPGDGLVLQGNLAPAVTRGAAEAARRAGARVVLNPAPFDPSLVDLVPLLDVLVLNAGEAAAFAGTADRSLWPPRLAVPLAVVTLGAEGCLLLSAGRPALAVPAPPVDAVDTVGAGDTAVGTFAAEWLATGSAERAARLAVAAASEKVRRAGTVSALPSRADLDRLRRSLSQDPDR